MDPAHEFVDIFHAFFFRKNNLIIIENPPALVILQNTPKLFQNYILVHIILHLDPYLTFYNYK
jgi:hypothetical protein